MLHERLREEQLAAAAQSTHLEYQLSLGLVFSAWSHGGAHKTCLKLFPK